MCLPSLELWKSLYTLFLGFIFKDLNPWSKQGYLFLFVADICNPIPIIVKLWESQADMGLLFFFFNGIWSHEMRFLISHLAAREKKENKKK